MSKIKRMTLVKIHTLLAAFILPITIMFAVTGGLYTWGIKGEYDSKSFNLPIEKPLKPNLNILLALVEAELAKRDLSAPTGNPKIKKVGTSFSFEWTGSNRDVSFAPTRDPKFAKLKIKETSWYRQFVQLHKAKGGILFKVFAAVFSVGLLALLITGCWMAWQVPNYRIMMLRAASVGVATFVVVVLMS
ncbi:MAG: PepSY domain-containing protein [Pseudomonadales bacterium]|nr:PepSY domain-containing protein [Pseudomonadales bacterium]